MQCSAYPVQLVIEISAVLASWHRADFFDIVRGRNDDYTKHRVRRESDWDFSKKFKNFRFVGSRLSLTVVDILLHGNYRIFDLEKPHFVPPRLMTHEVTQLTVPRRKHTTSAFTGSNIVQSYA